MNSKSEQVEVYLQRLEEALHRHNFPVLIIPVLASWRWGVRSDSGSDLILTTPGNTERQPIEVVFKFQDGSRVCMITSVAQNQQRLDILLQSDDDIRILDPTISLFRDPDYNSYWIRLTAPPLDKGLGTIEQEVVLINSTGKIMHGTIIREVIQATTPLKSVI